MSFEVHHPPGRVLEKIRCGECGHKGFEWKNARGLSMYHGPGRDHLELKVDLMLWVCPKCQNYACTVEDADRIDKAMNDSWEVHGRPGPVMPGVPVIEIDRGNGDLGVNIKTIME